MRESVRVASEVLLRGDHGMTTPRGSKDPHPLGGCALCERARGVGREETIERGERGPRVSPALGGSRGGEEVVLVGESGASGWRRRRRAAREAEDRVRRGDRRRQAAAGP